MKFKRHIEAEDSVVIDLTSLIDVLFVLVLFFVVSTTFANYSEMEVNLPSVKPSTANDQPPAVEAEINISAAGIIDVRGKKITRNEDIPTAIHQNGKANSAVPVLIKADKKVAHGVVIGVLDELKRSGFEQVAIATEAATGDRSGPQS